MDNLLASVDFGSKQIKVLVAHEKDGIISLLSSGVGESAGVRNGVIIDVEKAIVAFDKVFFEVCEKAHAKVIQVAVNMTEHNLSAANKDARINIKGKTISEKDIELALETASNFPLPSTQKVMQSYVNNFTIDYGDKMIVVEKPFGMTANSLAVNIHTIIASNDNMDNIRGSIMGSRNRLGISNIVPNAMASSVSVISDDDKDGVCVLDIGAGTTDIAIWIKGSVQHNMVLNIAGNQITEDIAESFGASFDEAERLKTEFGAAKITDDDRLIEFKQANQPFEMRYLSQHNLIETIIESYLKIFNQLRQILQANTINRSLKSGFVLVGGATKMPHIDTLLQTLSKNKVRLFRAVSSVEGSSGITHNPIYACSLGLLLHRSDQSYLQIGEAPNQSSFIGKIKGLF